MKNTESLAVATTLYNHVDFMESTLPKSLNDGSPVSLADVENLIVAVTPDAFSGRIILNNETGHSFVIVKEDLQEVLAVPIDPDGFINNLVRNKKISLDSLSENYTFA